MLLNRICIVVGFVFVFLKSELTVAIVIYYY